MTDSDRYAWIQLALTPYIGADSFLRLIQHFGDAQAALRAPSDVIEQIVIKGKQAAQTWYDTTPARAATDAALQWEQQEGCRLLLLGDADYPTMLTEGITPPPLLFVRGDVSLLQHQAVAMVGSRHATPQAMRIAHNFAHALSEQDITVISGMASGIDTAAHTGALAFSGSTIAIWGTGIDRIYPNENKKLAYQIAEKGLIVSEFPLGTRPMAGNFPRRNRLIAAQARVTLVVEAALKSGSLITARLAADMGREVMAIPSSIDNPHAKGCHKLIKDGAKLVECVEDIINECPILLSTGIFRQPERLSTALSTDLSTELSTKQSTDFVPIELPKIKRNKPVNKPTPITPTLLPVDEIVDNFVDNSVNESTKSVLNAMGNEIVHPDFIAEKTNIPTDEIYAILLECELAGWVMATAGGRYQRTT